MEQGKAELKGRRRLDAAGQEEEPAQAFHVERSPETYHAKSLEERPSRGPLGERQPGFWRGRVLTGIAAPPGTRLEVTSDSSRGRGGGIRWGVSPCERRGSTSTASRKAGTHPDPFRARERGPEAPARRMKIRPRSLPEREFQIGERGFTWNNRERQDVRVPPGRTTCPRRSTWNVGQQRILPCPSQPPGKKNPPRPRPRHEPAVQP